MTDRAFLAFSACIIGSKQPIDGGFHCVPLHFQCHDLNLQELLISNALAQTQAIRFPCGDSVALNCEGIDFIVNSLRYQVLNPQGFCNFGIDPSEKDFLIVKSARYFHPAFRPIAMEIIYMAASGATAPLLKEIPYEHVDLYKYPLLDDSFKV